MLTRPFLRAAALSSIVGLAMSGLSACGGSMRELNTLARDDLQCSQTLTFTKVDEQTRVANGCGKEARYVETCNADGECHWSRDSGVQRTSL